MLVHGTFDITHSCGESAFLLKRVRPVRARQWGAGQSRERFLSPLKRLSSRSSFVKIDIRTTDTTKRGMILVTIPIHRRSKDMAKAKIEESIQPKMSEFGRSFRIYLATVRLVLLYAFLFSMRSNSALFSSTSLSYHVSRYARLASCFHKLCTCITQTDQKKNQLNETGCPNSESCLLLRLSTPWRPLYGIQYVKFALLHGNPLDQCSMHAILIIQYAKFTLRVIPLYQCSMRAI